MIRGLVSCSRKSASVIMEESNSLTFFTANHSKHDSQWRMTGGNISVVCVACLVELLENPAVLHLRKRKALGEVIFLLSKDKILPDLLCQNTRVAFHLCGILVDLLASENDLLTNAAIEALVMIMVRYCSESHVAEIVEKLESRILELNNLRKSYPFVVVLGRLLNAISALCQVTAKNSTLLDYILSNVSFPEDSIQAALVFILLQIFANEITFTGMSLQIKENICKEVCAVLCKSSNHDVQANALGILKCLSTQTDVLDFVLKSPSATKGSCSMLEGLKKLIMCSHGAIQAGAIQCISDILKSDSQDSPYTAAILKSGIGEMLLEDLETSNDIILGSAFCCVHHMARSNVFYSESYSIYGMESVILGVSNAMKLKNPEITRQALCVLSIILASHPEGVPLFSNEQLYSQCATVLLQALKSADHRVLVQAAHAVEHFLRPLYLPPSAGFGAIVPLVSTVISLVQNFTKPRQHLRNIPKGVAEELMCTLLRVVNKSFTFVEEYRRRKPSYETLLTQTNTSRSNNNESIEQFVHVLWKAVDQTCVPALMANYESIENPAVFHSFFAILLRSISSDSECRESFAKKLASGSFVRLSLEIKERFCRSDLNKELGHVLSLFLVELCLALSSNTESEMELKKFLKPNSSAVINSISTCLAVFTQSSVRQNTDEVIDEVLFSTQCVAIELLYVSSVHEADLVPLLDLMTAVYKYLVLHSDFSILPRATLQHLLYLWVKCFSRLRLIPLAVSSRESIRETQEIISQGLLKLTAEEFRNIYIHNVHFVGWVFCQEPRAKVFGRETLMCFLRKEVTPESSDGTMFRQLLQTNPLSFSTVVSLITCDEDAIVHRVVTTLETLIREDSDYPRLRLMANHMGEIFHKLFLSHKTKPLQDHSTSAMLDIMIAVQMKFPAFDIKLMCHVVNLLTSTNASYSITMSAINYLNVILGGNLNGKDPQIAALLLSNKAFCSCIQEVLNTNLVKGIGQREHSKDATNSLAGVLVLISYLVISQKHVTKDADDVITVNKKAMISLVNQQQKLPGLASLIFWDAVFRTTGQANKPAVTLSNSVQGTEEVIAKLSEVDLQVLLVYLQNCMINDSETVRQCAAKCFGSFLDYVADAKVHASNPWNRVVLESQLVVLSLDVLTSSLVQLCVLIMRFAPRDHHFTDSIKSTVNSIVNRIPSIPTKEEDLSWHCIGLLAQAHRSVDCRLAAQQRDAVVVWLKRFKGSLCERAEQSTDADNYPEFCNVSVVVVAKDSLRATVPKDHELLSKLIFQLLQESNKDVVEPRGLSGCGNE